MLVHRQPVLNGITNGIDPEEWNPKKDKHLAFNYDINNFVEGKKENKKALQKELGLPINENIPMVAFIGRLDPQKGADILMQVCPFCVWESRWESMSILKSHWFGEPGVWRRDLFRCLCSINH